jgi:DNA-binding IscR family transcriptional regulator
MWNATEAIRETLRSTTLADLAAEEHRLEEGPVPSRARR